MSDLTGVPPSYETRLAALEARVLKLEARLGTSPVPGGPLDPDEAEAWLGEVASLARNGQRAAAITLYLKNMAGSDEPEAQSFVDDLIQDPPGPG